MGRRGPAPTPSKLLRMRGTFRRARHAGSEPQPRTLPTVPTPPKRLGKLARQIWRETAKRLVAIDLLTASDLGALEAYCRAFARAIEAEAVVEREGRTIKSSQGRKRHPELITAERAWSEMRAYESRFGLTPADRARLRVKEHDDGDETAAFLFGARRPA